MILAFDTYYFEDKAKTACLCFQNWEDATPLKILTETLEGIAEYEPGSFYKRELPCILSLLKTVNLKEVEYIVIDGFVVLDDNGKAGLGAYLYKSLEEKVPVIGVAKSSFHQNEKFVRALLRGESQKPLYITSAGIGPDDACKFIRRMSGKYRMPDLLRMVDQVGREV
ncbi:MAG: endonuclease V [Saprospiraceae bacterium]